MSNDTCKRCGRVIQDGELVTGFDFSSDSGEHITCPRWPTDADISQCVIASLQEDSGV